MLQLLVAVFVWVYSPSDAVTFPRSNHVENSDLDVCLRSNDPVIPCLTSGAVQSLVGASAAPEFELTDGLKLVQDFDENVEMKTTGDPREPRTLLESIGMYMERRYLHWDLDDVFPGLVMRVGPSARGSLHFLLDKRRMVDDRSLSTGRLIIKRTLLPVLLGVKLNVAALIPMLFAALILLVKKALILSKFSFLLSGLSLLRQGSMSNQGGSGSFVSTGSFGGGGGGLGSFGGGGGGLGSFGPPKHLIIDRPIDHQNLWLSGREGADVDIP